MSIQRHNVGKRLSEIVVHGNGPFPVGRVQVKGKALTLRAAPGYRPRFAGTARAGAAIMRLVRYCWPMANRLLENQYTTSPAGAHRNDTVKMTGMSRNIFC